MGYVCTVLFFCLLTGTGLSELRPNRTGAVPSLQHCLCVCFPATMVESGRCDRGQLTRRTENRVFTLWAFTEQP